MSQSISLRQAALVVLLLALVQFVLQMNLLTGGVEYISASLAIDDTYYYLQTAWNTKHLGFVTFDGLHPTNGVQLLWFVFILLLAMVAQTKTALLLATLAVTFLLNGLCFLVILKMGAVLKRPMLALFMASLWSLQSLPFRIYSMGMENSLHALVFWAVIWQSVVFLIRVQQWEKVNWWGLTAVLILNAWTRLDSGLLSALLFLFCVGTLAYSYRGKWGLFGQQHLKAMAGSALAAGLGLTIQLAAFWLMGGSWLPVSALVKTSGAIRGLGGAAVDKFIEVFALGMPAILQGRLPGLVLVLLGLLAIGLVLWAQRWRRDYSAEIGTFLNLWLCLLVGELLYYLYIAVSGVDYYLYFAWYRSPSFLFWILTTSLLGFFTFERLALVKLPSKALQWGPLGLSLLTIAVSIYLFARGINFRSTLYTTRYEAALWIGENSHPDTIFAAWNTGQLGFFSNRTFINLDGVINHVDYYKHVLRGPVPLTEYLLENGVEYVVDYDTYGWVPNFPVVQRFPIHDEEGRTIQMWQIKPQISTAP
jgi:hypothetical protein